MWFHVDFEVPDYGEFASGPEAVLFGGSGS